MLTSSWSRFQRSRHVQLCRRHSFRSWKWERFAASNRLKSLIRQVRRRLPIKRDIGFVDDERQPPQYALLLSLELAQKGGDLVHRGTGNRKGEGIDPLLVDKVVIAKLLQADDQLCPLMLRGSSWSAPGRPVPSFSPRPFRVRSAPVDRSARAW